MEESKNIEEILYSTIYNFILEFTSLEANQIIQAYQNRVNKPSNSSYLVFSLENISTIGTAVKQDSIYDFSTIDKNINTDIQHDYEKNYLLKKADIKVTLYADKLSTLQDISSQIDFYFSDAKGTEFFIKNEISPLHAENWKENTAVDEHNQYKQSISNILSFSYWKEFSKEVESFNTLNVITQNTDIVLEK